MFRAEQTAEKYRRDRQKVGSEGSLICLEVTVRREICAVREGGGADNICAPCKVSSHRTRGAA